MKPFRRWRLNGIKLPGRRTSRTPPIRTSSSEIQILDLESSGILMVPNGKDVPLVWLRVQISGWNGGRVILERVNGENVIDRLKRGGVANRNGMESYCTADLRPGETEAFLRFPIKEGETTFDLDLSGHRYRTATFTFNPAKSLKTR